MCAQPSRSQPRTLNWTWPAEFGQTRRFTEESTTYVNIKRELDADGEQYVDLFLRDSEETIPDRGVESVREFCHGVSPHDLVTGRNGAGQRRAAWLDDRCGPDKERRPSANCRHYRPTLSATELYRELLKPLHGHEDEPDVERRLIYISNIDPFFILALTETAHPSQVNPLRDALRNHIPRQSSLKVKIQSSGYKTFQIEMHLPYFVLRKRSTAEAVQTNGQNHLGRGGDLAFLNRPSTNTREPKDRGIYPAQFSLVLSGRDNRNWTGYCFETGPDNDTLAQEKVCDEGLCFDPIVSYEDPVHADTPILDPRSYFLRVLEVRATQILKEWELVVEEIASAVTCYGIDDKNSIPLQFGAGTRRADLIKMSDDWTRQATKLVNDLLEKLSETLKASEKFRQRDYYFFHGIQDAADRAALSLHGVETAFEDLKECEERLIWCKDRCRDYRRDLEICILREHNEAAARNVLTTEFTIMVLYPIALAACIFSMQGNVLWFPLNTKTFIISILVLIALVAAFRFVISQLVSRAFKGRFKARACHEASPTNSLHSLLSNVLLKSQNFRSMWQKKRQTVRTAWSSDQSPSPGPGLSFDDHVSSLSLHTTRDPPPTAPNVSNTGVYPLGRAASLSQGPLPSCIGLSKVSSGHSVLKDRSVSGEKHSSNGQIKKPAASVPKHRSEESLQDESINLQYKHYPYSVPRQTTELSSNYTQPFQGVAEIGHLVSRKFSRCSEVWRVTDNNHPYSNDVHSANVAPVKGLATESFESLQSSGGDESIFSTADDADESFYEAFNATSFLPSLIPGAFVLKYRIESLALTRVFQWVKSSSPGPTFGSTSNPEFASYANSGVSSGDGAGKKRDFNGDDEANSGRGNGDDEDKRRKTESIKTDRGPTKPPPVLACPFTKEHPEREWPKCQRGWPSVHRIKEHIYRNHGVPIHCDRCFKYFKTEDERKHHYRDDTRCDMVDPPPEILGVDSDTIKRLKSRVGLQNTTEEAKWENMFRILFPQAQIMPSPYCNLEAIENRMDPETRAQYRSFLRRELPDRVIRDINNGLRRIPGLQENPNLSERCLSEIVHRAVWDVVDSVLPSVSLSSSTNLENAAVEPVAQPLFQQLSTNESLLQLRYVEDLNAPERISHEYMSAIRDSGALERDYVPHSGVDLETLGPSETAQNTGKMGVTGADSPGFQLWPSDDDPDFNFSL